ncbi:hypothetical protein ACFE04_009773 [Oxalis oulophora]
MLFLQHKSPSPKWFLYLVIIILIMLSSGELSVHVQGSDTLQYGLFLGQNETLVSSNEVVVLGFFSPAGDGYTYLGIWFVKDQFKKPVWVANRDNALLSATGNLTVDSSGNLMLTDAVMTNIMINSDKPASSNGTILKLLDSGNLVLLLDKVIIWQSFDNPTDTFLPGMSLGWLMPIGGQQWKLHLVSWSNPSTPTSGSYAIGIDVATKTEWGVYRKGTMQRIIGDWNGSKFNFFLENSKNDQVFTFVTNTTDVLLSFSTSRNYIAVWYTFAANGDINHYKLTDSGITITNYPLCDTSAANVTKGCVDDVSSDSDCKAGDEFVERKGSLLSSKVLLLGLSDCEFTCKSNCSCTAYASLSDGCQLYYGDNRNLRNIIARGNNTIYMRSGGGNGSAKVLWWIIAIAVSMFFIFIGLVYLLCIRLNLRGEYARYLPFMSGKYTLGESTLDLSRGNDQELTLLSFASLASATNNFSKTKKLGEGGFGAVYKAWDMWMTEQSENLLDPKIAKSCDRKEAQLCIQLGLLCIQDDPEDRPSMSDVIFILSHEETILPSPKQPVFSFTSKFSDVDIRITSSSNDITFSTVEGLLNNGDVLWEVYGSMNPEVHVPNKSKMIISTDPETGEYNGLAVFPHTYFSHRNVVTYFGESLVLLDKFPVGGTSSWYIDPRVIGLLNNGFVLWEVYGSMNPEVHEPNKSMMIISTDPETGEYYGLAVFPLSYFLHHRVVTYFEESLVLLDKRSRSVSSCSKSSLKLISSKRIATWDPISLLESPGRLCLFFDGSEHRVCHAKHNLQDFQQFPEGGTSSWFSNPRAIGLLNNGNVLWEDKGSMNPEVHVPNESKMIISTDPETGEYYGLAVFPHTYFSHRSVVTYFEESLVLLDKIELKITIQLLH